MIKIEDDLGTIYCGVDNLTILKTLPDNSVDMIYTDPPYNTGKSWEKNGYSYDDTFETKWHWIHFIGERLLECKRVMKEGGSIFVHLDYRMSSECKTYLMDPLFDDKNSALDWLDVTSIVANKAGLTFHIPQSVPEVTPIDDKAVCLDPFAGSLSFPKACKKLGRRFIGIELNDVSELWDS